MNTKLIKTLLVLIAGIVITFGYYGLKINDDSALNEVVNKKHFLSANKQKNKKRKIVKETNRFNSKYQEIVAILKPIEKNTLKEVWQSEYGCYKLGEDECNNMFLTASSLEEASWMQRQGYPSRSEMTLLENPDNIEKLQELAKNNKFTPAMALLAIKELNDGNYHEASSMALKLSSYSSKTETFPHRIYGESLMAENNLQYGLLELKVASLLGDTDSQFLFNRYVNLYPDFAVDASDHANLYMGRVFHVPYGEYPKDERPKINLDDG